jgi:hypothetical protein
MRYAVLILPFIYSYVAIVIEKFSKFLKKRYIRYFILLLFISLIVVQSIIVVNFYQRIFVVDDNPALLENFYEYDLSNHTNIVISSPIYVGYRDVNATIIYSTREGMYGYYENRSPDLYFISDCELFCVKEDISCNNARSYFINNLRENLNVEYEKRFGGCNYYVISR